MLSDILTKENILIDDGKNLTWEGAIKKASKPLLNSDNITNKYVESMINTVNSVGPYFNIGDQIVLAHSRPENGVKKISLSLLKTNNEINLLDEKHPAKLWFVLGAEDSNSHLSVIQDLVHILTDKGSMSKLLNSTNKKEIYDVLSK